MPESKRRKTPERNRMDVNAHNARKRAKEQEARLFAEMVIDRMADEDVITIRPELLADSIDIVWGPDTAEGRAAYADMEAFCSEHGRSFREVMGQIEQIILERLLPRLGKKLAGRPTWTPTAEEKAEYRAGLGAK